MALAQCTLSCFTNYSESIWQNFIQRFFFEAVLEYFSLITQFGIVKFFVLSFKGINFLNALGLAFDSLDLRITQYSFKYFLHKSLSQHSLWLFGIQPIL